MLRHYRASEVYSSAELAFLALNLGFLFKIKKVKKIYVWLITLSFSITGCHAQLDSPAQKAKKVGYIWKPDFNKIFSFDVPILEIIIRGSILYLSLFFLLRIILKRETAAIGITDLLVVVLLADASQNAMSGGYTSLPDGLLLVSVIIFWSHFLNWLGFKSPFFYKIIKPAKLLLVKEGRMIRRNMKKELLTEEELLSEIRLNGVKELKDVEEAYMETDGRISVITYNPKSHTGRGNDRKKVS